MTSFGANEIRLGEALYRSEAHLVASCELYGAGRIPDALLQAARPITDILPWLETEIRSADGDLRAFFSATSAVGAGIRQGITPRALRRALKPVAAARAELADAVIGPSAQDPSFRASVALALLDNASDRYRQGVVEEDLGGYQSAYALAQIALDLLLEVGADDDDELSQLLSSLQAVFPSVDPPGRLARPDDLDRLAQEIARVASAFGAQRVTWTLKDSLRKVERSLDDVRASYERGQGPVAARLAATLFVRSYDPIRRELAAADPDVEARLTALLGFELRSAINDSAPRERIAGIVDDARRVLARCLASNDAT